MFLRVRLGVGRKETVPLSLERRSALGDGAVNAICLLGDVECLVWGETELGLESLEVVRLESYVGEIVSRCKTC